MSFKDQLREILDDYSDKYSTGLQLSNIVKLNKATDQAIASIVGLVKKDVIGWNETTMESGTVRADNATPEEINTRNKLRVRQRARLTQEDTE